MIPNYLNSSSTPSPFSHVHEPNYEDHDHLHGLNIGQIHHQPSLSSSHSCHIFFNSTHDQTAYYNSTTHDHLYQPQLQSQGEDNYASHGGSFCGENKVENGLKLSLWKKEEDENNEKGIINNIIQDHQKNPVKWMSTKMRLMQKMKNADRNNNNAMEIINTSAADNATLKLEDHHHHHKHPSSPVETDYSSNSSSNNSSAPIRVCADCNTTKTPLWRSGPKGPKSLCNACGIRQRKARRAMAAAAAANGTTLAASSTTAEASSSSTLKIKVQSKEKMKNTNNHVVPFKKRCKLTGSTTNAVAAASSSSEPKKIRNFEDLLINISKNLSFHRVFPQDEKEAAILLMALSCGLVHS